MSTFQEMHSTLNLKYVIRWELARLEWHYFKGIFW